MVPTRGRPSRAILLFLLCAFSTLACSDDTVTPPVPAALTATTAGDG